MDILLQSVLTTTQDKALDRIEKLRQKNRQLSEKIKELEHEKEIKACVFDCSRFLLETVKSSG